MSIKEFKISEVEIVYRPKVMASQRPKVSKPQEVYDLLMQCWDENKICLLEEFKVILLNRGNRVLGVLNLACGGINSVSADPKVIMAAALKGAASAIILAHNHPSGNLKPSRQDLKVTSRVVKAGEFLDIEVLDHLVVSDNGYYSFSEEGVLGV